MADLQFVVSALDKATAALLKITAQLDKVGDKLDKLDGKVAKLTVALDDKASPGLDNVERKVKNLDGKKATVKVDVDKSLGDSIIKFNLLGKSMKNIALGAGVIAAAPQIAALGSALVTTTGAAGVLPGVLGAAALAVGTLKVGFTGLGDALGPTGTPAQLKKVNAALALLPPNAKAAVAAIRDLGPAWSGIRLDVQQRLFEGVAAQIKGLAATYLPMLHTEMGKTATVFNVAATSVSKFFQQKSVSTDMQGALMSLRVGVTNVALAARPLAQVFVDIFSTSAARIPGLTQGVAGLAAKFAGFIANARQTGELGKWIDQGVAAVKALGQIVGNVGSILMSVFRAAAAQGATLFQTIADVTGKMADFLKSGQGQSALIAVFGTIRAAIAAITPVVEALLPLLSTALVAAGKSLVTVFQALGPPLKDIATALSNTLGPVLGGIADQFARIATAIVPMIAPAQALIPAFHAIAQALAEAAKVAADFFTAFAGTGAFIFKAIVPLITAAVQALTGLLHIIEPIAPALGVAAAAFVAFKTGAAGIGAVQSMLTGLGGKIADVALNAGVMTEKFTGSAAAGEKVASAGEKVQGAFAKVGAALPLIGAGVVAIGLAYEEWGGKADQAAAKVLNGSVSMAAAIKAEGEQIHSNQIEWLGGMNAQESYAAAAVNVRAEIDKQRASLSPMAQLQSDVARAQADLNDAVAQFGPRSQEAIAAAGALNGARAAEQAASRGAADAEKSLGDEITNTMNAAAAAANADLGYQQSLLTLRDAQDAAAEAARNHAAGSREVTAANLAVEQASLAAAAAAQRKAEADATAAGASNVAQIGAQAYKEELLRQAEQMTGTNRQALIDLANHTNTAGQAADSARLQSQFYKDELGSLARDANGPLAAALATARQNFDTLGGAHASAEQKARAQKDELLKLANMASGKVRTDLLAMANQIQTLPDGDFTVSGTGEVRGVRSVGGTFATGGIVPGYTPGRDVHRFQSATGGTLDLSGGEAVMRPEWTRAVGPGYVNAANAAARSGRAQRFVGGYADGGILPHQRFVMGGDIKLGGVQPFVQIPRQAYDNVLSNLVKSMVSTIKGMIASAMAAAAAALGGGGGGGGGPVNAGAGGAMSWIIAHESGGRNVKNATSSASGYFQMINGTWKAYGGSTPTAMQASYAEQQAVATRYVNARYGGWDGAVRYWQAHGNYDQGGYLQPGMTMAMNLTGTSERVLSPSETAAYDRAPTRGGDGAALLAAVQGLRGDIRALSGDVDHHSDNAAIAGRLDLVARILSSNSRSAGAAMQSDRRDSELGAWA